MPLQASTNPLQRRVDFPGITTIEGTPVFVDGTYRFVAERQREIGHHSVYAALCRKSDPAPLADGEIATTDTDLTIVRRLLP